MNYLQPLKDYLKNNSEEGLVESGWSDTDVYLAKKELQAEKTKKIIVIILGIVAIVAIASYVFADSGTAGSFFGFLSGKVISVQMHQDVINATDFKYNFWIETAFENAECYKPQDCIGLKGEGWGCIDNKCVDMSTYGR